MLPKHFDHKPLPKFTIHFLVSLFALLESDFYSHIPLLFFKMTNAFDRIRCFRFRFDSKTLLVWCSRYASLNKSNHFPTIEVSLYRVIYWMQIFHRPHLIPTSRRDLIVFPLYSNCFFCFLIFFFRNPTPNNGRINQTIWHPYNDRTNPQQARKYLNIDRRLRLVRDKVPANYYFRLWRTVFDCLYYFECDFLYDGEVGGGNGDRN